MAAVGFTPLLVDATVLVGTNGAGWVVVVTADIECVTEDTCGCAVSELGTVVRSELRNWAETGVEAATGRGAGAVGDRGEAGFETVSVVVVV